MQRASRRKFHYIYKTTCIITKKFYVGMHSTDNIQDGYLGSGKRLWYSINKYGKENHICEILEFLPDRSSLKNREKEIVNEKFLQDSLCMNLVIGGSGGFTKEAAKKGGLAFVNKMKTDETFKESVKERARKVLKQLHLDGRVKHNTFTNKNHSESSKQKISEKAKQRIGKKNSQFGTCWITNGTENKKISKDDLIPDGWHLGRKIKR